jgi:hypothetical protein
MGKTGKRRNCYGFACQAELKAKLYVYGRSKRCAGVLILAVLSLSVFIDECMQRIYANNKITVMLPMLYQILAM